MKRRKLLHLAWFFVEAKLWLQRFTDVMAEHESILLRMGTTSSKTSGTALIELPNSFLEMLGVFMFSLTTRMFKGSARAFTYVWPYNMLIPAGLLFKVSRMVMLICFWDANWSCVLLGGGGVGVDCFFLNQLSFQDSDTSCHWCHCQKFVVYLV